VKPGGAGPLVCRVPCDSVAVALGAEAVAAALERTEGLVVQRTSSRGMAFAEPLVERVPAGEGAARDEAIGFANIGVADVPGLVAAWRAADRGAAHPACLGRVAAHPFLAPQQRVLFARAGRSRPLSIEDHAALGGGAGLAAALAMPPAAVVDAVADSGLRGRGGAAFPAGIKWRTVAAAAGPRKAIVVNADEGDSGTFADRLLLEGDPLALIEGVAIAAHAVGADRAYVYVRSEYPLAIRRFAAAIGAARGAGWFEALPAGFDIELRKGAGSYVCGEETALLESIEGRRGIVRAKPPVPAVAGLFGRPTLVHNVLTLAAVPAILAGGAAAHAALGCARSRGTMPFQLAGNVRFGGLVEVPFGLTVRELVFGFGGGTASGRPVKAIQLGGPLGTYLPPADWDLPLEIEALAAKGHVLGHGGLVVHDDTADMGALARHAMAFCAHESCGKCTPCRIGAVRGVEVIDRLRAGDGSQGPLLVDLCDTMQHASLCAMGGMTPYPVRSALVHWPQDFGLRPSDPSEPEDFGLRARAAAGAQFSSEANPT
jgi:formate dehydrogenase iron-sulfur subunit